MYTVVFAVVIKGSIQVGGLDQVWAKASDGGRIEFFNFSPNLTIRYTFWTELIGGMISYIPLYAANQTQVSASSRYGCANRSFNHYDEYRSHFEMSCFRLFM